MAKSDKNEGTTVSNVVNHGFKYFKIDEFNNKIDLQSPAMINEFVQTEEIYNKPAESPPETSLPVPALQLI